MRISSIGKRAANIQPKTATIGSAAVRLTSSSPVCGRSSKPQNDTVT
jgi:hypothetical protein